MNKRPDELSAIAPIGIGVKRAQNSSLAGSQDVREIWTDPNPAAREMQRAKHLPGRRFRLGIED